MVSAHLRPASVPDVRHIGAHPECFRKGACQALEANYPYLGYWAETPMETPRYDLTIKLYKVVPFD